MERQHAAVAPSPTLVAALVAILAFAVATVSCTSSMGEDADAALSSTTTAAAQRAPTTTIDPEPGAGRTVRLGRANWDTGHIHAQIVRDLLEELGYQVADPAEYEFGPDFGYQRMAEGEIDLWANSWYPHHETWWEAETKIGERVGDHLSRLDRPLIPGGGLQGMLITKSWAAQNEITTLDQIASDKDLWSQLDYDQDGKGEIYGCPGDWTCDDIIFNNLWCNGWNGVLEQLDRDTHPSGSGLFGQRFQEFLTLARSGKAAIAYVWTPTHHYALAQPGELTMWLSVDESSVVGPGCSSAEHLERDVDQTRPDGTIGYTDLDSDICLEGPDGCQLGWLASDIEVTGNSDWLEANPAAEALLAETAFDTEELSQLLLDYENSSKQPTDLERISAEWIDANRSSVDRWLDVARRG